MKKLLVGCLVGVMALGLIGCGAKEVQVTVPLNFFGGATVQEVAANIEAQEDILAYEINEEESNILVTITEGTRKELRDKMVTQVDESLKSLYDGESKVNSYVKVDYDDTYTKFDIYVDYTLYTEMDEFYSVIFFAAGSMIQNIDGIPEADLDVEVNFIDNATKEVKNTTTLKEYMTSTGQ